MTPNGRGSLARARGAVAVLAVVCGSLAEGAAAQGVTTSGVEGRVTDPDGLPIPGARVEISRDDTGEIATTVTDPAGRFGFANLRPGGPYSLEVSRIGHQTVRREGLQLWFSDLPQPGDPLEARYVGALERGAGGGIRAVRPYVPQVGPSQWQAQFGVRLRIR